MLPVGTREGGIAIGDPQIAGIIYYPPPPFCLSSQHVGAANEPAVPILQQGKTEAERQQASSQFIQCWRPPRRPTTKE